jgi:hypothetical protein
VVNALADVPEAERPHFVNLALGQNDILELIANGSPLGETLAALLRFLEREVPEMLCSVLLLDRDGVHLRYGAAQACRPPTRRPSTAPPSVPRGLVRHRSVLCSTGRRGGHRDRSPVERLS